MSPREYYLKNRPRLIKKNREWSIQNRDRVCFNKRKHARRRAFWKLCTSSNWRYLDKLHPFDLWKIAKRQKLICPLTGEKLTRDNISVDHIVSRCQGGKNIPSNVRLTTRDINWFKRTMTDEELLVLCHKVIKNFSIKRL